MIEGLVNIEEALCLLNGYAERLIAYVVQTLFCGVEALLAGPLTNLQHRRLGNH